MKPEALIRGLEPEGRVLAGDTKLGAANVWMVFKAIWMRAPKTVLPTQFRSLGQEDPLEEEMATHSSILAWRIP